MSAVPDRVRFAAAAVFVPLLALWTWKLLEPNPVPESLRPDPLLALILAKSLHASGYALLAALAWVWAPTKRWRAAAVAFMLLHGVATEVLQYALPFGRSGKVTDVLIDWAGITVGTLVAWRVTNRTRI